MFSRIKCLIAAANPFAVMWIFLSFLLNLAGVLLLGFHKLFFMFLCFDFHYVSNWFSYSAKTFHMVLISLLHNWSLQVVSTERQVVVSCCFFFASFTSLLFYTFPSNRRAMNFLPLILSNNLMFICYLRTLIVSA